MTRRIITLANERLRARAMEWVRDAKLGDRLEMKGAKRSGDQNAAMWAMLGDLSEQLRWGGQQLSAEDFKLVMLDALRRERKDEMRIVPSFDRTGFVNVSPTSSSDLTHEEMRDLLTIIRAFGDQQGIEWSEPKTKGDQRPVPPPSAYEEQSQ